MLGEAVDARLWGKDKGLPRSYPVVCHLLDTAATAGALWDRTLTSSARERLAAAMGMSVERCRRLVCLWAGLHDVGKIIPPFQALVPQRYASLRGDASYAHLPGAERRAFRHDVATQWALAEIFESWGYPTSKPLRRSVHHQVAQLLGGHHGRVHRALRAGELSAPEAHACELGGSGWQGQRVAHAEALRRLTGCSADDMPSGLLPAPAAVVLLGLVVVADWLVSPEEVIIARLPAEGWRAGDEALREHWALAVVGAAPLVAEAGLGVAGFPERSFGGQFPFAPNPLQESVAGELPALLDGPGLLLVTAPTGEGKTEAALHAASLMARAAGASGVFFALPTMATADAMYRRVADFAKQNVEGDRSLALLHSMAWLSEAYAVPVGGHGGDGSEVTVGDSQAQIAAGQWLRGAKRGLLAPLAAGTIDQALTGVLPVRYNVLRLLGLSNKVLVVDEAHAYDPWMHSLLVRLLEWLGACGAPVVLLSATLSGRTASSLVDAYRRGCGYREPSEVVPVYPGWVYVSGRTGEVSPPRVVEGGRPRRVEVRSVPVLWGPTSDGVLGREAAVAAELRLLVERGGCALVCCTTVAQAQQTFRMLAEVFPSLAGAEDGLMLLHSRFPGARRAEITRACERAFGKPGVEGRRRPGVSVLVATQVVEQSLDLDFDVVISDLAPLAQLLQRVGRCMRHDRSGLGPEDGGRPGWVGDRPRLTVLEPVVEGVRAKAPRVWGSVYDQALLTRTSELLRRRADCGIAVPGDVQELVDAVYAEDFGDGLGDAAQRDRLAQEDAERWGAVLAEEQLARMTLVNPPMGMSDLAELSRDGELIDEALLTTRLGADSERAVCVYEQPGGCVTLDAEGDVPVPGWAGSRRLSLEEVRAVVQQAVPLPGGWLRERGADQQVPESWEQRAALRDLSVLRMRQPDGDAVWSCKVGDRSISVGHVGVERL
ncbi:CRISPR-associated helicase Cas3' [Streptomyces celluloflavus]|uniref:CRISPR-associated helicase Cas3' n=1 Tax=Streptomyces celluloflavus TaxID=58344 RepID=UPI00345F1AA5|nr:CRISPR-associated helicase Cas3' [Streptomyces celluloflavus]